MISVGLVVDGYWFQDLKPGQVHLNQWELYVNLDLTLLLIGEKVTVSKKGHVEVTEGKPDCTSTFMSERAYLRMAPSFNLSQVISFM